MFLSTDLIRPADLRSADSGAFLPIKSSLGSPLLVGGNEDRRIVVSLNGKHPFRYYPATEIGAPAKGLLIPSPLFEVDAASMYDSERIDGSLGDLVFADGRISVLATSPTNGFGDLEPVALWNALDGGITKSIGFHRWRVTTGNGADAKTLWEHAPDVGIA